MLPDLFKRLKPLLGTRIDDLWWAYQLGTPEERRAIEETLTIIAAKRLGMAIGDEKIVLEPPRPNVIGGGHYTLGVVEYPGLPPYPFTLYRQELLRHVFLLGPSGTGKSTFIIGLLRQLLHDNVAWWAIDYKRNYRCLINDPHGAQVLVITVGRNHTPLKLNVLAAPSGVTNDAWIEALADIMSTAFLLLHGARNVLKTALLGAITAKGTHATLREARDLVATQLATARSGSRKYGWLESAHRTLDELTKGALGETLNNKNAIPLGEILATTIVFELEGLGEDQQRFFSLYILQALLLLRKHQSDAREVLRHVLVFDEAHNVFRKDQWGELSLPSKLAREVREYGEAIISATQQADVADSLIANSGTKIFLRTDYPKDADFASRLLQVDQRWLAKIPMGNGIARLANRYLQPFLFAFPQQPLKNQVTTDDHVGKRYTQWALALIAARLNEPGMSTALQELPRPCTPSNAATHPNAVLDETNAVLDETTTTSTMSATAQALLLDVAGHPISTITQRYARLQLNPKTGTTAKDELAREGMITFTVLPVLNSRVTLLTLTPTGIAAAQHLGVTPQADGRAGLEHEFWRQRLRERCEQRGYTVTHEYALENGGRVDLHAKRASKEFLIEIETGKSDIITNIRKCQGHHAPLIVFFTTEQALAAKRQQLPRDLRILSPTTLDQLHRWLLA